MTHFGTQSKKFVLNFVADSDVEKYYLLLARNFKS